MITIPRIELDQNDYIQDQLQKYGTTLELSNYLWKKSPSNIGVTLYVGHDSHNLLLSFVVKEKYIRATYKEHLSNVFQDSCVEFFFRESEDPCYTNIEINPYGAALVAYGPQRQNRERRSIEYIKSLEIVTSYKDEEPYEGLWSITYHIPLGTIEENKIIYANAYKCGDLTLYPHYITLFKVDVEKPDFHRSEFFQPLRFL
ncbi:MAG: hypothetical protein EOM67_04055 [Spirochaetia bacterium]|nr:hypothetical protein [Spirochaetia bacterium]